VSSSQQNSGAKKRMAALTLAALGVVYGDIGTSPLYAFQDAFAHGLAPSAPNVLGVISLILWSLVFVVFVKYGLFVLRADNHGEGGTMSLMALLGHHMANRPAARRALLVCGLFAAALFYGDGAITPAISVISAIEGISVATPAFSSYVVPISCVVLLALFLIQRHGTGAVGVLFGPCMAAWFVLLAVLGVYNVAQHPAILQSLNPLWGARYFEAHGLAGLAILGSVVLALTGAEALYADLGHFGRRPIMMGSTTLVMPALVLNYLGQGGLLLANPQAASNPFYLMAPHWGLWPMVVISTVATVIASQAVISGVFSMTKQAIALGYLPRMSVQHTSSEEIGQIFVPAANRVLLIAVLALVLIFKSSNNLSAAYGLAVNGTMFITSLLAAAVFRYAYGWSRARAVSFFLVFATFDLLFLASNALKFTDGGWIPMLMGCAIFFLMSTWKKGRDLLRQRLGHDGISLPALLSSLRVAMPHRALGCAVFMHSSEQGVPPSLLHNLRHNQVLHETCVILNVRTAERPFVSDAERLTAECHGDGVWTARLTFGFRETPDIPAALARCAPGLGVPFSEPVSYFFNRETLAIGRSKAMSPWREKAFIAMSKNAGAAASHFCVPTNKVVELGACVEL
jgi:KUP system potassium uptake protein